MKISILLPCYKSEKLLEKVFWPSFEKNTKNFKEVEIIFYDNGGNGHWSFLDCENSINICTLGDGNNIGLNPALNACSKYARGDYFYLCHTDMYLMPNWDQSLLEAAKNQPPKSFLFCSRSVEPVLGHTRHHIIKNYGMEADEFKEKELLEEFKNYKDNTIEVGARMPFFMHRKLWEAMQGVDENYFSYCTDDDLIQEAYDCGVRKFWMVYNSLVYHLVGKSNNQQKIDKDKNEPYLYFIDKWKKRGYINAKHPSQWHNEIIPFYTKIK